MAAYLIIIVQFCSPLAASFFAQTFFPDSAATPVVHQFGVLSPFATAFSVPLNVATADDYNLARAAQRDWAMFLGYVGFALIENGALLGTMIALFNKRWRVSG
jgi:hypothetical protein